MSHTPAFGPIHVLDFEGSLHSGVVEAGIACYEGGLITECFSQQYRPTGKIAIQEESIHGLKEDTLHSYPTFNEQFEVFQSFRKKGIWAAHHAPTEANFLKRAWAYPGQTSILIDGIAFQSTDWGPWIDTHLIYQKLYPRLPSYQLMDLVAAFHLRDELYELANLACPHDRRHPHAALFDAIATSLLLKRLMLDFGNHAMSVKWLLAQSLTQTAFTDLFLQMELQFH